MSITTKLRKLVNVTKLENSQGMRWLYVGDNNTTVEEKLQTVQTLMTVYGGVKISGENFDDVYMFKIDNDGYCKITITNSGRTVIDYSTMSYDLSVNSLSSHLTKEFFNKTNS